MAKAYLIVYVLKSGTHALFGEANPIIYLASHFINPSLNPPNISRLIYFLSPPVPQLSPGLHLISLGLLKGLLKHIFHTRARMIFTKTITSRPFLLPLGAQLHYLLAVQL